MCATIGFLFLEHDTITKIIETIPIEYENNHLYNYFQGKVQKFGYTDRFTLVLYKFKLELSNLIRIAMRTYIHNHT